MSYHVVSFGKSDFASQASQAIQMSQIWYLVGYLFQESIEIAKFYYYTPNPIFFPNLLKHTFFPKHLQGFQLFKKWCCLMPQSILLSTGCKSATTITL